MKLALICPNGFKSAICSGRGRLAGASALGAARFAAQFPADETCGGAAASPNAVPELNGMRCSIGRIGAIVKSNPPSEPTPEPRPISSIGGITARGTADSADAIPPGNVAFVRAEVCGVAVAALAKLAIGRAPMTA